MNSLFLDIYIKSSILIAVIDVILAVKSIQKKIPMGRFLGYACVGAAVVDVSYLISILYDNYLCMSIMSSIYFVSIDLMLICLFIFTVYFTKSRFTKKGRTVLNLAMVYALFEVVVFAMNPFCEIAVHYVPRDTIIAKYSYQMKPLYWMHLIFTYMLVVVVLVLLIRKMCSIPREYKAQYCYVIIGIVAIVCVNAVFLFWPNVHTYNFLDYSICGYSLTAFLLYWSCFNYSARGMLNRLKNSIFDNIGQGIVLFDYGGNLILHNTRADSLLGGIDTEKCAVLDDFLKCYGLWGNSELENDSLSIQCYVKNQGEDRPLRCDIRRLKNEKAQQLGLLFVFSDAALEMDLLTGFQNWDSFQRFAKEEKDYFPCPTAVAVCDINSLSVINSTQGNTAGDQKIRQLAECMRRFFPKNTYYVRGIEAKLIALCRHGSEDGMKKYFEEVSKHFDGNIQYAVSITSPEQTQVLEAIRVAEEAMRAKKLLDRESIHSDMLTSLIRALQECDSDTEHHVRRTQQMGAELGKRIGLTDNQQSKLSLLCLLHDIGKIGVPLEILNKPGKLSEEEWNILRSHPEKGYEIANSNKELQGIAEEILHHHERWDGHGYPDGLSKEDIPLLSRVIAVVDSYDAMTNDRSYRPAMPVSVAMEELKRCAGSQFDPYIVSEFLKMLKEKLPDAVQKETKNRVQEHMHKKDPDQHRYPENENNVHRIPYSRYLLDDAMYIVSVDDNFEVLTGYTAQDVRQRHLRQEDLIPQEDRTEYLYETTAALAKSPQVFQEHKLRRKDGTDIYVFCFGRMYFDSAVRSERSEIIIADITNTHSMKMLIQDGNTRMKGEQ